MSQTIKFVVDKFLTFRPCERIFVRNVGTQLTLQYLILIKIWALHNNEIICQKHVWSLFLCKIQFCSFGSTKFEYTEVEFLAET